MGFPAGLKLHNHLRSLLNLSQGHLYINSSNPFDDPVIDPGYLSHSAGKSPGTWNLKLLLSLRLDLVMFREGLKLCRTLGNTAPLSSAMLQEISPGPSVQTDDDWDTWLATTFGTEYHPSCSCAMLPQNQGGVVDTNLKVYGLGTLPFRGFTPTVLFLIVPLFPQRTSE